MNLEWAEKIRDLRESLYLNQSEFAELLDISQQVVSVWETAVQDPTQCWQRIIQFLHDCPSTALSILKKQPWLEGDIGWGDRVSMILQALDWTHSQLATFMRVWDNSVSGWVKYRVSMETCHKILISLLEIYSGVDRKQWPPGLYFEPEDIITEERIRLLRLSLGMKLSQLANLLRVDRSTVGQWESGRRVPGWCTNLLLRVIETYPRAVDLLERIPWSDERVSSERAKQIRASLGLTLLELAHFLGMTQGLIENYEGNGVPGPCQTLVYMLLEKYPDEFIPLVETISSPGGQSCPIW